MNAPKKEQVDAIKELLNLSDEEALVVTARLSGEDPEQTAELLGLTVERVVEINNQVAMML